MVEDDKSYGYSHCYYGHRWCKTGRRRLFAADQPDLLGPTFGWPSEQTELSLLGQRKAGDHCCPKPPPEIISCVVCNILAWCIWPIFSSMEL
ncbi:hypothetical protein NPIL_677601 [Nephila pilipes]|uniref:Uncharacterized protein n=1 Tax=Nephila pilipes TaxID=299642 RepID=A0A8X6PFX2_NEPPI|nr:hypothetical protein NPIL_677601 [Nephila pilipes]